jgi:hypothetical protein
MRNDKVTRSNYIILLSEIDIEDLFLHEQIDHCIVFLALPRLFYILLNVLYQLCTHRCLVVAWDVRFYRIDDLLVWHVAQQLLLVERLEVSQQLHSKLVLSSAYFPSDDILALG